MQDFGSDSIISLSLLNFYFCCQSFVLSYEIMKLCRMWNKNVLIQKMAFTFRHGRNRHCTLSYAILYRNVW